MESGSRLYWNGSPAPKLSVTAVYWASELWKFHSSDAQYTASTDNFGAGEPFQYNLEPDSVEALLEAEVSAASFRSIGHIGKADTV